MLQTTIKIKNMTKKSHELCQKAEMKYIPFGLEDLLPAAWECGNNFNETRTFEDFSRATDIKGNRIPNVIMLGATGSGKSYYGNGLLGAQNPCPPIHSTIHTNYFGCGKSSNSVTTNVKAQYGTYFGDMYREYGVKPMEVNIYDTPGTCFNMAF
jgi:predicted GTPase